MMASMTISPPHSRDLPVFDDITDEHGFEAVQSYGGMGVLIGARRQTAARFRIQGVEEALAWLEAAL